MKLIFSDHAWRDYLSWRDSDAKVFDRLNELIKETKRTPFKGNGKPEPLKGDLSGWWSRRITKADRLVYRVSGSGESQALEIAQCRYHY
ncbi:Txe/YoeB family addiction module toxin [Rhodovulum euryhalinum]|uniref:Txe/YoeB family addiction module toxin n=1 Tax=Rhodovulum euryhalinum TaxID=35805 RepID=UPI00104728F7|nr:Txe/YoeB family addiction module toxin [Rhodovulum euryhalinum]